MLVLSFVLLATISCVSAVSDDSQLSDDSSIINDNSKVNSDDSVNTEVKKADLNQSIADLDKAISSQNEIIKEYNEKIEILEKTLEDIKNTTVKLNTTIIIDDIEGTVGESTKITAHVIDEDGNVVTSGNVAFKLNGKTLTDNDGNVIYAHVKNGVATINYTPSRVWTRDSTIISAVYSGNNKHNSARNSTSNVNIKNADVDLKIVDLTSYNYGDETKFIVSVKDKNGENINHGKVAIKINGKTLQDDEGNSIIVNVKDGLAIIPYTINLNAKLYDITAVYGGERYDRGETSTTLNVTKSYVNFKCDPVFTSTDSTTVTAQIVDKNNKLINHPTKVAVKINDKTISHTVAKEGIVNVTLPTAFSAGSYTLHFVAGDTSLYNSARLTTMLIKE